LGAWPCEQESTMRLLELAARLRRYEEAYNAHDADVDQRDEDSSDPFQFGSHGSSLDDDRDTVDDDLE
jgi:hypothetical protein